MNWKRSVGLLVVAVTSCLHPTDAEASPARVRVLIVDGFSNHDWRQTTSIVRRLLEATNRFEVDVSTSPPTKDAPGWDAWQPAFARYEVVIQNCNSLGGRPTWPREVELDLERYVRAGGGLYILHSANNAFGHWDQYDRMIGLGWRGKDQGAALVVDEDGSVARIPPGEGKRTYHGPRRDTVIRALGDHPIHRGYPRRWKTPLLEVYKYARGPAEDLTVISCAHDPETEKNWPIEWVVRYRRGAVYNSTFGHVWAGDDEPAGMRCVGVQTTLIRAVEWLATGEVTWPVPTDFPTAETIALRPIPAADVTTTLDHRCFRPPARFAGDFGDYRCPLEFDDGTRATTPAEWQRRRTEIQETWHGLMGPWPPLIAEPQVQILAQEQRESFVQHKVSVEIGPDRQSVTGYLLVPDGAGPFPAVVVVYYDPETAVGLGKENRDFALQLARRGFVALSIGTPEFASLKPPYRPLCEQAEGDPPLQPLSALAYVAANCHTALARRPDVDAERIGIVGHSYGGKWAMFAACLYEKFACAVSSDPGIVFDESRPNINYWEPWYLGYDPNVRRQRGVPDDTNPRTGAYKTMIEAGRDLHELHALMAPRPFLISGGAEDPPKRWRALNHTVAVNALLGCENRVAMTNRPTHAPTPESNAQIYAFFEQCLNPAP